MLGIVRVGAFEKLRFRASRETDMIPIETKIAACSKKGYYEGGWIAGTS
jgi:hypothetical protein